MNTFAIGSLPVHFSVAKLFNFRWQYTVLLILQMGISPSMNIVSILLELYKLCLEKYLK